MGAGAGDEGLRDDGWEDDEVGDGSTPTCNQAELRRVVVGMDRAKLVSMADFMANSAVPPAPQSAVNWVRAMSTGDTTTECPVTVQQLTDYRKNWMEWASQRYVAGERAAAAGVAAAGRAAARSTSGGAGGADSCAQERIAEAMIAIAGQMTAPEVEPVVDRLKKIAHSSGFSGPIGHGVIMNEIYQVANHIVTTHEGEVDLGFATSDSAADLCSKLEKWSAAEARRGNFAHLFRRSR